MKEINRNAPNSCPTVWRKWEAKSPGQGRTNECIYITNIDTLTVSFYTAFSATSTDPYIVDFNWDWNRKTMNYLFFGQYFFKLIFLYKQYLVLSIYLAYSISDVYIVLSKERGGEGYEICFGCNSNTEVWLGYNKGDALNKVGTYKIKQVDKY